MKASWSVPLGLVMILLGGIWAAQGVGWLHGSPMTGQTLWAVVGPVVAVLGVLILGLGLRGRRG